MASALQATRDLLNLEELELNLFRGHSPRSEWQRVFGGQVIGQALTAAARTVEGRICHSLHAYFLRLGDPKVPIIYDVDRIRDGRSFTTPTESWWRPSSKNRCCSGARAHRSNRFPLPL